MVAGRDDVSHSSGRISRVSRNALGPVHAEATTVSLSREEDHVIETMSTSKQSHGRFRSEFDLMIFKKLGSQYNYVLAIRDSLYYPIHAFDYYAFYVYSI